MRSTNSVAAILLCCAAAILAGDPAGLAANWLLSSAVPIACTEVWRRAVLRWLPPDPFAFIFGAAFFGAAVAVVASWLVGLVLLGQPDVFRAGAVPSCIAPVPVWKALARE